MIDNEYVRYVISVDGRNLNFIDKQTNKDYCAQEPKHYFLSLKKRGDTYRPSTCTFDNGKIIVEFKDAGVRTVIKVSQYKHYFVFEVASVEGEGVEEIVLSNLHLTLTEHIGTIANLAWNEQFAAAVMALNLQVNARGMSGQHAVLWSACYPKTGLVGAKIGLIGCPTSEIRTVIKEMVQRQGIVHSKVGGAWALDVEENKYSYLFAKVSEADVDQWIALAKKANIKELLLYEIGRFGHYDPFPTLFPNGLMGVRAVVDKIHRAGLQAGWHMHSFSIQKDDPWVTPVPDKRLAKRTTLTLAAPLTADATFVPTVESPKDLPTQSGYSFRGGMDILVDDEIITYSGISTQPPYGLTGCRRGMHGTKPAAHEKGAALHNLQEVFGMYLPDGDSSLLDEMAQRIADVVNTCGFDLIYFDGLDGADAFAGLPWGWHYGAKFALNVFKRVKRDLRVEISAWLHHTWHIHTRLGAWDHPVRGPKKFIDLHCTNNKICSHNLLPTQLGWWAFRNDMGPLGFATIPDEIEYLCAKCVGHDVPFSLQNVSPSQVQNNPTWANLLSIISRYERLRLSGLVPESIKAQLRVPGDEFHLEETPDGKWKFMPVMYDEHKVTALDGASNVWKVTNRFETQQPRFRIRALMSAASYDSPENIVLADFADVSEFSVKNAASGMNHRLETSTAQVKPGKVSGCYTATSSLSDRRGSWAMVSKTFSPLINMAQRPALGVWVHGDGKGQVLNLQLVDYRGAWAGVGEHYVIVDFVGWRYFELIEPEGERWSDYVWNYGWAPVIYREAVKKTHIASLNLYINNVPPKDTVTCYLSPIKALAIEKVKLERPRLTMGGKTIVFPVSLESGCYLEFNSLTDCKLYDPNGVMLRELKPEGEVPILTPGENKITFVCEALRGYNPRAIVTTITFSSSPLESTGR